MPSRFLNAALATFKFRPSAASGAAGGICLAPLQPMQLVAFRIFTPLALLSVAAVAAVFAQFLRYLAQNRTQTKVTRKLEEDDNDVDEDSLLLLAPLNGVDEAGEDLELEVYKVPEKPSFFSWYDIFLLNIVSFNLIFISKETHYIDTILFDCLFVLFCFVLILKKCSIWKNNCCIDSVDIFRCSVSDTECFAMC